MERVKRHQPVVLYADDSENSRKAQAHLKERQIDFAVMDPSKARFYSGPAGPYPLLEVWGTQWRGFDMIKRATSMDPHL